MKQKQFWRKKQNYNVRLQEKLAIEDMRKQKMREQREKLTKIRMRELFKMERQRQDVKNALFQMSVWNTFDSQLVSDIFKERRQGGKPTIGEQVRKNCVSARIST